MLAAMKHQYLFHSPKFLVTNLTGSYLKHLHCLLIHGQQDGTVPIESSISFEMELTKKVSQGLIASSTLNNLSNVSHCEMVLPTNKTEKRVFTEAYQLIQKFIIKVEGKSQN